MAIQLNDNIKINAGKPSEAKYLTTSNIVYTGTTQVNSAIPISERHIGLTVNIGNVEYWYKDGITNSDLVLKGSSLTANNGLTKTGNNIYLGGTLTGDTKITGQDKFNIKIGDEYSSSSSEFDTNSVILKLNALDAPVSTQYRQDAYSLRMSTTDIEDNANSSFFLGTTSSSLQNIKKNKSANLFCDWKNGIDLESYSSGYTTKISIKVNSGITVFDNTSNFRGVQYAADFSSNYSVRSLVDKGYVTGITSTLSTTANNGLTKSGTTLSLGGKLQKYTTYIFADPSNTPFPSGIPSSIHFGASGQTSTPTGGTTLINNYPLGSVNMVLSGSSVFGDNIPKVATVNFNYSDTSIHQSTADGISYTDYVQQNDSINISSFNTTGAQGASINISSTSGGDANVNMIAGLSSANVGLTTVDFNYNDGIAIARSITLNDSGTVISNVNGANISGFRMYDTGTTYYNNNGGFAIANNLAVSQVPKAIGVSSFAMGNYTEARATGSFAAGLGSSATNKRLIATGATSFNFSENNASQTVNHGALAANSFILGGVNHNVPNTSPRSGIIGGSAIKVVGSVTDTVHMPKVRIGLGTGGQIPTTLITGSTIIGRNSTNGELSSIRVGNGVTFTNGILKLGGVISGATSIGLAANNLTITATTGTLRYGGDYSANYNVRSVVDKGYVTGNTFTKSSSTFGHKTLTGGTAVVSTTAVASGSVILLTIDGGTQTNAGTVRVSARSAGTSFTITSSNAADTSAVGWAILN